MIKNFKSWLYYHEEVTAIIIILIIASLLFGSCIGLLTVNSYFTCQADSNSLDLESKWNFWGGCYLELDGVWYDRDIAKDILRQQYQLELNKIGELK